MADSNSKYSTVKHQGAKCLRHTDDAAENNARREALLTDYPNNAVTRMVADPRFDAEKDVEVWQWPDPITDQPQVGWFVRWYQPKKAREAKLLDQLSATQVASLSYWDAIKPLEVPNKKKVAMKLPSTVSWSAEDGSGRTVIVPVPGDAVGKNVNHPSDAAVKKAASAAPALSSAALGDAISSEANSVDALLQRMDNRAAGEWHKLYAEVRAKINNPQKMTLAQYAAQLACAKLMNSEDEALGLLGKAQSRDRTPDEWAQDIGDEETRNRTLNWINIVRGSVEAASIIAVAMDKAAAARYDEAKQQIAKLTEANHQHRDAEQVLGNDNVSLKDTIAALKDRNKKLDDENADLRAQLAEARAGTKQPSAANGESDEKKKKKQQHKEKSVDEKKKKKRPASESMDDEVTPAVPTPKRTSQPASKLPLEEDRDLM